MALKRAILRSCWALVLGWVGVSGRASEPERPDIGSGRAKSKSLAGLVAVPRDYPGMGRWQMAHKVPRGQVFAIAWSPDSNRIAFSDVTYIRICDAKSFSTQTVLVGHASRVTGIDWNQATNLLVSGSLDGTVRIWSGEGVPGKVLGEHVGAVYSVAWTRDGTRLASAGNDGTVRIWKADGSPLHVIKASTGPIRTVAWSPDGQHLVSGDDDYKMKLWSSDGHLDRICEGHNAPPTGLAWSSDGKHFASSNYGYQAIDSHQFTSEVRFWNSDGSPSGDLTARLINFGLCWSPRDPQVAVFASADKSIHIFDPTGKVLKTLRSTSLNDAPLAWSPDGEHIAGGGTGSITVVDVKSGATRSSPTPPRGVMSPQPSPLAIGSPNADRWIFRLAADGPYQCLNGDGSAGPAVPGEVLGAKVVSQIVWNPRRDQIAFVSEDTKLGVWSLESSATKLVKKFNEPIANISWTPSGDSLAVMDDEGVLRMVGVDGKVLFERKTGSDNNVIRRSELGFGNVRFNAKGDIAVVEGNDVAILGADGALQRRITFDFRSPNGWGDCFWWSKDGSRMTGFNKPGASGLGLLVWNLKDGRSREITDFVDEVGSADCSPDGKLLLVGFEGGEWELQRLDIEDPSPRIVFGHLNGMVRAVAFSSNGQRFATGGWDAMIKVWSSDGKFQQSLAGHRAPIYVLKWSADDQRLISIARDQSMYVWSLKTGRPEMTFEMLPNHELLVTTIDGRLITAGNHQAAQDFIYLIERANGAIEVIDDNDFFKRTGQKRISRLGRGRAGQTIGVRANISIR